MKKIFLAIVFVMIFLGTFYISWNIQTDNQSSLVLKSVRGMYGSKLDIAGKDITEKERRRLSGFIEITTPEQATRYSRLFKYAYPEFSIALDGFSKSTDIGQNAIALQVKRGSIIEAAIQSPGCTLQVDVKDKVFSTETIADVMKKTGGVCGPISVAKSIIEVLGVPPEVYADAGGKNFNKDFLNDMLSKNKSGQLSSSMTGSKSMHENYVYNGHTFECGDIDDTNMEEDKLGLEDRKANFANMCKDVSKKTADGYDCMLSVWKKDFTLGHLGRVTLASYDEPKAKCSFTITSPGSLKDWAAFNNETGPVNSGTDTWEARVQPDNSLSKYPLDMNPIKTVGLNNTFWKEQKFTRMSYMCCKKVPVVAR